MMDPTEPPTLPSESEKATQKDKLLSNRWLIFGMLFGVTGFLGIPVLCMSPAFSKTEKIFWSIAVTVYTSVLVTLTGGIIWWAISRIFDW